MHTFSAFVRNAASTFLLCGFLAATGLAHADDYDNVNKLINARQLPEALAKAELYLGNQPRDPQMRFLKGVIVGQQGKPDEAIEIFTKITQDYPELPEPYNNLAVLYAAQNQLDKAKAALEMAIRTNPSYATAHENLGDVYAQLAGQAYAKAVQLEANNTTAPAKLALTKSLLNPEPKTPAVKPRTSRPAPPAASSPARP